MDLLVDISRPIYGPPYLAEFLLGSRLEKGCRPLV